MGLYHLAEKSVPPRRKKRTTSQKKAYYLGTAEAVCLMTAGEPVEGEKDATAAGCIYYGPDRSKTMAEAFLQAALVEQAMVLRQIYVAIATRERKNDHFTHKMAKLAIADLGVLFDRLSDKSKEKAEADPAFVELMKNAGMWDGANE